MSSESFADNIIVSTGKAVLLSIGHATVKFVREIPAKFKSFCVIKLNEYKSRPKRTEMNKVYVLVGYTTKQHVDSKYRTEHMLVTVRRILLVIIFLELVLISFNKFIPMVNFDQYKSIFGISDVEEITGNDPFGNGNNFSNGTINIGADS